MLIDFEQKFRDYLKGYKNDNEIEEDKLIELAPDMYLKWVEEPKEWLKGKSPITYFEQFETAALIEELGKYIISKITLPGVLLNRIADTKQDTYPYIISLLTNYEGEKSEQIKVTIIRLIEEMDLVHPYDYYIKSISQAEEQNDFYEACADELKDSGDSYKEQLIAAYEVAANQYVSNCLIDVLCDLAYDDRTYQFALEKFLYSDSQKAFYASCLGKIGNEKAIPYLEEELRSENINYYDYVSIKNAVEELGGEIDIDRDFSGDIDYESLKNLGE